MWEPGKDNRGYVGVEFRARTQFEINPFRVVWSLNHNCWVAPYQPDTLLLVHEVWIDRAKALEMESSKRVVVE